MNVTPARARRHWREGEDLIGVHATFVQHDPPSHYVIDRIGPLGALVFEPGPKNEAPNTKKLLIRPDILRQMIEEGVVQVEDEAR